MKEPLTGWRCPLEIAYGLGRPTPENRDRGVAVRAIREACGLSAEDVAAGWGIDPAILAAVEAGVATFPSVPDFRAACHQLWLWGAERGVR